MDKVIVIGAGGLAREVVDILLACNQGGTKYEIIGFIDENVANHGKVLNGFPILGDFSWFQNVDNTDISIVSGIGNPVVRKKLVQKALDLNLKFINILHPSAIVTPFIDYGVGIVITAGCILTNQIQLGNHVFLNLDCTVGHDVIIGDYCNINPGVHISGNVTLETGCEIGTGANIIQGINIGKWSIIGAGSVVVRDLPANVTAVGIPSKVIKTRTDEIQN